MNVHALVRALFVIIVLLGAVMLLGVMLNLASWLLGAAFRVAVALILVALMLRFISLMREKA